MRPARQRRCRGGVAILGLLTGVCLAHADTAALRALLKVPCVVESINLDLPAIRAQRAQDKLAQLNSELLADRLNPRLNFRAGEYLREMGSPLAREYARRTVDALLEAEKQKPLDGEQTRLLLEALLASAGFDELDKRLPTSGLEEAHVALLKGETQIFRVWEATGVAAQSPGGDRLLNVSLAALRNPESAAQWKTLLASAAKELKRAAQLAPKEPRPHRSLAVALIATAYVDSALLWRSEQKTASLMPIEAFAHLKEAANLTPDDAVAQWEAYESRIALERVKGASAVTNLSKEALKFVSVLSARLAATAASDQTNKLVAAEVLAVILAQTGKSVEALKVLDGIRGDPPNPRIDLLRFRLLVALGRPVEAAPVGEAVLANALLPGIAAEVAGAFDLAGEPEKADKLVTDALLRWAGSPELRLARAVMLLRNPDGTGLSEAGQILNRLALESEDDPIQNELKFARAVYFGIIGDADAARRVLAQLEKIMPARVEQVRKALNPSWWVASSSPAAAVQPVPAESG